VSRHSCCGPLPLMFLVAASLFFSQGCARPILRTLPVAENEVREVTSAFTRYQEIYQNYCGCCLDAEADAALSVSGWFSNHTGKLSGYLQAMAPGYIKFVALNPLGQPVYILVSNGSEFKSLNVLERKAYLGSVYSETFKKFSPAGFEPGLSFYWLTGRLEPKTLEVAAIRRDKVMQAYWLQLGQAMSGTDSMILFDPRELRILRHVLLDEKGEYLVDVRYESYQPAAGEMFRSREDDQPAENITANETSCSVPGRVLVSSGSGAQKIEIQFSAVLAGAEFSPADFDLEVPVSFEHLFVK
jgi:outer membrane lipoprotein-sorting protein